MYCPKCGAQNLDNSKFCYQCGFKIEPYNPQTRTQAKTTNSNNGLVKSQPVIVPTEAQKTKKSKKGIIVLFSILALVILVTNVIRYERERERRAVQVEIDNYTDDLNDLHERQEEQEQIKKMCEDILEYYRDRYDPEKEYTVQKLSDMGEELEGAVMDYDWADYRAASVEIINGRHGHFEQYIKTVEEYKKNILGEIISTAEEQQEIDKKLMLLQVQLMNY